MWSPAAALGAGTLKDCSGLGRFRADACHQGQMAVKRGVAG
jgi:hypothetical protein